MESCSAYGSKPINYASSPTLSVTAYQSIHGFFHHLFIFDANWNPYPLTNLPVIGISLTMIISLIILIVTSIYALKYNTSELAFGSFIIAGLLLNPASLDYHYVLIILPIIILVDWLKSHPSIGSWAVLLFSFILVALSLPYTSPKVTGGVWAIFAYPKLFRALGLWGLTLRASYISKSYEDRFQN